MLTFFMLSISTSRISCWSYSNAFLRKCKKKYVAVIQDMANQALFEYEDTAEQKSLQTKKQTKNNRKSKQQKLTHTKSLFRTEIFYCSRKE